MQVNIIQLIPYVTLALALLVLIVLFLTIFLGEKMRIRRRSLLINLSIPLLVLFLILFYLYSPVEYYLWSALTIDIALFLILLFIMSEYGLSASGPLLLSLFSVLLVSIFTAMHIYYEPNVEDIWSLIVFSLSYRCWFAAIIEAGTILGLLAVVLWFKAVGVLDDIWNQLEDLDGEVSRIEIESNSILSSDRNQEIRDTIDRLGKSAIELERDYKRYVTLELGIEEIGG